MRLHWVMYTFYFFTATGCDYVWEDNIVFFPEHSFRERSSAVSRIRVVVESSSGKKGGNKRGSFVQTAAVHDTSRKGVNAQM